MKINYAAMVISLIIFSGFGSPTYALGQWFCSVENFSGLTEHDADFIQANLKKKFLLAVSEDEIFLKTISDDFQNGEIRFHIFRKGTLDVFAMNESSIDLKIFAFPKNVTARLAENGFFNATMIIQGNFFVNSWLLRCEG